MDQATKSAETLRRQIAATEEELSRLREQLAVIENEEVQNLKGLSLEEGPVTRKWPLELEEYKRYGRQMIVPNIGIQGQLRLKAASVLIVGAGGLGCPAAAYIAGAGVGTIGIVDGDVVETSNLHRQILHSTAKVGMKKVDSAISFLTSLNPNLRYIAHTEHLTPQNAREIVEKYDLVLDCTDHPTSRYLISDICVLLHKPLISASALRTDGQLIILNSPPLPAGDASGGPCYRCVFPKPPPAESVVSCGDGGILGPVVGTMGVLQALEAVKLITAGKLRAAEGEKAAEASMLLFSANSNPPFRSVRLRARRPKCFACSAEGGLTLESLSSGSLDYVLFCGVTAPVKILRPEERIEASEYEKIMEERKGKEHLLVDVREKVQFDICSIKGSINVPFSTVQGSRALAPQGEKPPWIPESLAPDAPIYFVCRLGNDSQVVARKLKESGLDKEGRYIGDIKDGLKAWKEQVDSSWPEY
ncbi:molybdenum cofactor synthesis protein-like protein [Hyaloscypha variabilis F]|uniref:Adenylyltransferase and sulfurtransferase uba4 n=1 Tax=Hyaloscypha variabilis (strain UAMH 11265 / GT02V1 / F) TaxID=1149755 RepID=A0A2J6RLY3_HYAVF|nr:molybdenum cofactor synthesis protein-like protein [Hyaloscypha variabilis F]